MLVKPKDSFVYDSKTEDELSVYFDNAKYFSELGVGMSLKDFRHEAGITKRYIPTVVYEDETKEELDQIIAMYESVSLPIFGITYSIDSTQYVFADPYAIEGVSLDHTVEARSHAQHIANFVVHEGRLNMNKFAAGEELSMLIASVADTVAVVEDKEMPGVRVEIYTFN